jgi:elongation factor G
MATIPQAEMHDLIVNLRSLSQGTGFFAWRFDRLEEVPERLTQAIVQHHQQSAAA